jgi:hypothetical protein
MSRVYLSAAAREHVAAAQRLLDEHAMSAADERCVACAVAGPCG